MDFAMVTLVFDTKVYPLSSKIRLLGIQHRQEQTPCRNARAKLNYKTQGKGVRLKRQLHFYEKQ